MTDSPITQPAPSAPGPTPTPDEAAAKLSELRGNQDWTTKFLAGNGPELAEFRKLSELAVNGSDKITKAMAGVLDAAPVQESGHMQMIGVAQHLREIGIRDDVIRQTLTGQEVTQAEHDAVARLKADRMRDHAWTKEFLAGNGEHKRDMMLMNIVLTSSIKKEAAA
ncbi:hypothetical protein [Bradyrhizobium sp. RT5a]|uniref:hypothetical protein n=1 Tax=Bradyrhizobium sp. RT5a TaxID=3156380 RepID=UPI0033962C47